MMFRRGKIKILFILAILPFYYANECLETVKEVCKEVIDEKNVEILETMEEMIANGTCEAPEFSDDFINDIKTDLKTELQDEIQERVENVKVELKGRLDGIAEFFQKIFNAVQGSSSITISREEIRQFFEENAMLNESPELTPNKNIQSDQELPNQDPQYWKQLTKLAKSCDELLSVGINEPGEFQVDPDGAMIGQEPISVFCHFPTNATIIRPNTERLEMAHNGSGYVSVDIDYNAPMEQIVSLVENSYHCEQKLIFSCFIAPIVFNGESFAKWSYRNGDTQSLISYDNFGCKCAEDGNCVDPFTSCNCDSRFPKSLQDSIVIKDKNLLPITGFTYGPFSYNKSQAFVQIQNLECDKRFGGIPSIERNDCDALKMMNNHRLQFTMEYVDNRNCYAKAKFSHERNLKLTVLNFQSERGDPDEYDYLEIYEGTDKIKRFCGDLGHITYEWKGQDVMLRWKTDGSHTKSSMTAYVNF